MNIFTPPVDKDKLKDRITEHKATSMLIDMLGDAMLQSNMPEDRKLSLRVLLAIKRLKDKFDGLVESLCDPEVEITEELTERRKAALSVIEGIIAQLEENSLSNK